MHRLFALATAAVVAAALAGNAYATHGGAEHRAVGHGATDVDETTSTTLSSFCIDLFTGAGSIQPTTTVTTRTQVAEAFDFDSRLTTEEAEDILLSEPHGHMRLEYAETVTTTVAFNPPAGQFCLPAPNTPPTGTTTRSATATADVTCLTVVGHRAAIGGRVTRWEGDFPPSRGLLFNATDNTVAREQLAPDQFAASFVAEAPQACPAPSADHPFTEGDVSIHES